MQRSEWELYILYIRLYSLLAASDPSSGLAKAHAWSQEIGGFNEKKLSAN